MEAVLVYISQENACLSLLFGFYRMYSCQMSNYSHVAADKNAVNSELAPKLKAGKA